jgi:hypothetical protein
MSTDTLHGDLRSNQEFMVLRVPLQVLGLSMLYASALNRLERLFPIKPDHTWAEVTGGVIVSLLPIALEARRQSTLDWRTYETTLWLSFFASGTPIILWQLGEAMLRQRELLRYTGSRERKGAGDYADHTTSLALGGRSGAGERDCDGQRCDPELDPSSEHA